MDLRVMTMNVQNTEGPPAGLNVINGLLKRLQPDVVCLQEVADQAQLSAISEGTGLRGTHQEQALGYQMSFADRYGGTAVATRLPHRIVETLDLRGIDAPDVPWCTLRPFSRCRSLVTCWSLRRPSRGGWMPKPPGSGKRWLWWIWIPGTVACSRP